MHHQSAPSRFTFRPFEPMHDFPALVTLINAIDAVDQSGEATSEERQREQLSWPGHDLRHDRWVVTLAEDTDRLLGYGDSWKMPTTEHADIYVGIHPLWRQQGLGSELMRRTLARAREQGATSVIGSADAKHLTAHQFLHQHGFQAAGAFLDLWARLPPGLPAPHWPAGYTLRQFSDVPDLALLVHALNLSYRDLFGHKIMSETDVQTMLTATAAEDIFLLFDPRAAIAGICRVRANWEASSSGSGPVGYLDPGVAPAHRRPQLYRSLALAGMHRLREHGQGGVVLESWGDTEPTIASYQELGFTTRRHFIGYRRTIT